MDRKVFTIVEANKRLPLIKTIVGDILDKGQKVKALSTLENTPSVEQQKNSFIAEIEVLMVELEELGCYFKDWNFEIGLVDFPAVINGKEVMLCWRSDEPNLRWYHSYDEGYPGRKLIPENLLP